MVTVPLSEVTGVEAEAVVTCGYCRRGLGSSLEVGFYRQGRVAVAAPLAVVTVADERIAGEAWLGSVTS